ncbi:MAG: GDSL-type esterase/lipase family protein, partial [Oscillospiraceae bacterium]
MTKHRDDSTSDKTTSARRRKKGKAKNGGASFGVRFKKKLWRWLRRLDAWTTESRRNRVITAVSVSLVGVLIVGGVAWGIVSALRGGSDSGEGMTYVEEKPVANYVFVDKGEYEGTLLKKTDDAGEKYLKETLFIGDSNMARLTMYGLLGYANVIGIESMGIQGVTGSPSVYFAGQNEPVTIPRAVSLMKPRRIVFNFGTNNLLGSDIEEFIKSYDYALNQIKEAYPYSDIIIMAVHPLGEKRSNTDLKQKMVDDYNLALIKYAKKAGYPYLDTAEVLKSESGYLKEKFAYSDGIHLTKEALNAVLSYVRVHSHIVDDARPTPIGSVATQVAPPPKPVEEGTKFDPALVSSQAVAMFTANGFTADSGHSEKAIVTWNWAWPIDGSKPGTENNVAQNLYNAYIAQNSVKTGSVVVSVSSNSAEYVFTVSVYSTAKHEHTYTWVVSADEKTHTGTCTNTTAGSCDAKILTHTPNWGAWTTDGTTCTRACKASGCTLKETHKTVLGDKVTQTTAPTATTDGAGYKTCTVLVGGVPCGAKHNVVIPKTGTPTAHTHAYSWAANADGTTHIGTCTSTVGTCDAKTVTEKHSYGADGKCTKCGYVPVQHTHVWSTDWKFDATNHWKYCTGEGCKATSEVAPHNFGDDGTATKCTVCGCTNPTPPPPPPPPTPPPPPPPPP